MSAKDAWIEVGDLVEYRCPNFGIVWQWRVLGIFLGRAKQEGLVELSPVLHMPGSDNTGRSYDPVLVPEPMIRSLEIIKCPQEDI